MRRWSYVPLLVTQGLWAKLRTPRLEPAPGAGEGVAGSGSPLRLLAFGDSIIAGVGVDTHDQALPAQLAEQLARRTRRAVEWRAEGLNGARSAWLLDRLAGHAGDVESVDLVVINIGINDVTTFRSEADVLAALQRVAVRSEAAFPDAVICQLGLPPLGAFPALPQPLRSVLGDRAARIDRRLGAWLESRPNALHLPFDGAPAPEQFARDGYHPAPAAVTLWAEFLAERLAGRWAKAARDDTRAARA